MDAKHLAAVKDYYANVLSNSSDLKTSACCTTESLAPHLRALAAKLHPEVVEKFYGCGSPIPPAVEGRTVLDLGCGSGRDCYLLSALVGPQGRVIGIDMTEKQLATALKHREYHAQAFGMANSNVSFLQGMIEDLATADIADASVDVVISNCVINLSPDKKSVFKEIFRVLKPGGELYFSDVFADRRIPCALQTDSVMLGECLGGALYIEDFRRLLLEVGCPDYRIVNHAPISLRDTALETKAGNIKFSSLTIRAFKVALEDRCEDYGQVAYYLGTIKEHPHSFRLDDHHLFEKGRPFTVCTNTANMLKDSRLGDHFRIEGNTETHYGLFPCGPTTGSTASADATPGACC